MASRRGKITLLKQKICLMQNQLTALEKTTSKKNITELSPTPKTNSREYRSPTFWGINPITFDEKYSPNKPPKPIHHRQSQQQAYRNISPQLKNIINTIDQKYYHQKSLADLSCMQEQEYNCRTVKAGQRFQFSQFGLSRQGSVEKISKVKTYQSKKTDLILNPEREKSMGRKIVRKMDKSPDKMLTQNPQSNPKLYFYSDKPLLLKHKGAYRDRNSSSLCLSASVDNFLAVDKRQSLQKPRKSNKKHFSKYFTQTLLSQIN